MNGNEAATNKEPEFQRSRAASVFELKGRLEGASLQRRKDPRSRFL